MQEQTTVPRVEIVTSYDADGREHDVVFVDGEPVTPTYNTIDPDDRMLHRRPEEWRQMWHDYTFEHASPRASGQILTWTQEVYEKGHIDPDEDDE